MGRIYILRNPAFKGNILKIGETSQPAAVRAGWLSRQTGVPDNFEVVYSVRTSAPKIAEARVHLLLQDAQINKRKEFFRVNEERAKNAVKRAVGFTECAYSGTGLLHIRREVLPLGYSPDLNRSPRQLLMLLMENTVNCSLLDKLFTLPDDPAFGFISKAPVKNSHGVGDQRAHRLMQELAEKGQTLVATSALSGEQWQVFQEIIYRRGQLAWTFSSEFREIFANTFLPSREINIDEHIE